MLASRSADNQLPAPPWQMPPVEVIITALPANKSQCTREQLRQQALRTVAQASIPSSAFYYTNGSVDPVRSLTGEVVVTSDGVLSWRTPDHCSDLQSEPVAIQHGRHCQKETVTVHSDSRSDSQVLKQPRLPAENVRLTTSILGHIQSLAVHGSRVQPSWVTQPRGSARERGGPSS